MPEPLREGTLPAWSEEWEFQESRWTPLLFPIPVLPDKQFGPRQTVVTAVTLVTKRPAFWTQTWNGSYREMDRDHRKGHKSIKLLLLIQGSLQAVHAYPTWNSTVKTKTYGTGHHTGKRLATGWYTQRRDPKSTAKALKQWTLNP